MAQVFYKTMISVDWLSLMCQSFDLLSNLKSREEVISDGVNRQQRRQSNPDFILNGDVPDERELAVANPEGELLNRSIYVWEKRTFGSKQFKSIYDVKFADDDGVLEPFAVVCSKPTLSSWDPRTVSVKLSNHLFYINSPGYWLFLLRHFLSLYELQVTSISRCDIAADFLYLRNRISGPTLADKIKSLQWWKCGSVNVSEHYKLPYTMNWAPADDKEGFEVSGYKQQGKVASRVETMTFGTMASDAQVCLYDKTLELNRSLVKITRNGEGFEESAKEYIRDAHKEAGVYHPKRHTWRLEIRLRNKALFLTDSILGIERSLQLDDLAPAELMNTFIAAADRYFKIVDPTLGGARVITPELLQSLSGHKNRLPVINLFPYKTCTYSFSRKKYHDSANKFHRSVITRLDQLGDRLQRVPCRYTKPEDADAIPNLIKRLEPIAKQLAEQSSAFRKATNALLVLHDIAAQHTELATSDDLQAIEDCREMLERHLNTESPSFTRNVMSTLSKFSDKIERNLQMASEKATRPIHNARPSDAHILLEAADVLKGFFVTAVADDRAEREHDLHMQKFLEAIHIMNTTEDAPPLVLDMLYRYCWSRTWIPYDKLTAIIGANINNTFGIWVKCGFDLELLYKHTGISSLYSGWRPPILGKFDYRKSVPFAPKIEFLSSL